MLKKLFPPVVVDDRGGYPAAYTWWAFGFLFLFYLALALTGRV